MNLVREGIYFCLVGPAGGGKTSACNYLLGEFAGSTAKAISVTTRAARSGEVNGVDKHFVTREDFEERIKKNEFFEWEETHGNLYGTLFSTLTNARASGIDLLLDVDIRGALTFKQQFPLHTVIVFMVPPSSNHLLARLTARGELPTEIKTRMKTAEGEYRAFLNSTESVDYFVINDVWEETLQRVASILKAERLRVSRLARADIEQVCNNNIVTF